MKLIIPDYAIRIRIEKEGDFYEATGMVATSPERLEETIFSTEPQSSYYQDKAVAYALSELAVAFERGKVPLK